MGTQLCTLLEEYMKTKRTTGIAAITLKDNDTIANVVFMNEEDLILITKQGFSIHFETKNISAIGRIAAGVKGIKLTENDYVLGGFPIENEKAELAVFTSNGLAKKVPLSEFSLQGRAGKGITIYNLITIKQYYIFFVNSKTGEGVDEILTYLRK